MKCINCGSIVKLKEIYSTKCRMDKNLRRGPLVKKNVSFAGEYGYSNYATHKYFIFQGWRMKVGFPCLFCGKENNVPCAERLVNKQLEIPIKLNQFWLYKK